MKSSRPKGPEQRRRWLGHCLYRVPRLAALAFLLFSACSSLAVVLYQTGFEASEGYNTNRDLSGQKGWTGANAGGTGLLSGWFPGKGQQAYIGYSPDTNGDTAVFVYQPLSKNVAQAQFSVRMDIEDSSNTNYDQFWWSAYNQQGDELFTVSFDNVSWKVYYFLSGATNATPTSVTFSNGVVYQLKMNLDFVANRWSATLDNKLIATNQPIALAGVALNFGDFDAVWYYSDPATPGNNFMVFDDYQVNGTVPQPQLSALWLLNQSPTIRLSGFTNSWFALDASTDLMNWLPLKTNQATAGYFDYVDTSATGSPARLYRARWVP